MAVIATIHRWAGGLIGLLLALLGLTGALLVWKGAWIAWTVPGSNVAVQNDPSELARTIERIIAVQPQSPNSIIFADHEVTVHNVNMGPASGFYANSNGAVLAQWENVWDRPEKLLFEVHHYLMLGDPGEIITGIAGLIGIGFVVTGIVLWWSTRRTFKFRLWPARLTRAAIIRQHRDLGVVVAPLLLLTMLTGVMMTLQPIATLLLLPFSSAAEMDAAGRKPDIAAGRLDNTQWRRIMTTAQERFSNASIRLVSLPRKPGDPVTIRMKQAAEWHNNGRTTLWFDGATGQLLGMADALELPQGYKIQNLAYPLHAAKIGGFIFKIAQTVTGLALGLLGSLAVWTFWFRRAPITLPKSAKRRHIRRLTVDRKPGAGSDCETNRAS